MPVDANTVAETLTEEGTASLVDAVEGYVLGGLEDFAFAATDLPNFLADTSPIVAAGQPTRQILRAACRSYARGSGPQNLPGFDAVWGGICEPYLESIGENPEPGSLAPPFTGGQCCGVNYLYTYSFRNPNTGEIQDSEQSAFNVQIVGLFERSNQPAQATKTGGVRVRSCSTGAISEIPLGTTFESAPLDQSISNIRIQGGAPDNCGNVPPVYSPPRVKPDLPDIGPEPIDFPGIGPIPITITFDPDGNINVDLPDIGVDFTVDDPFGLGGDDEGGGSGGPPPGDVGDPGSPSDTGEGGDTAGEAPEGSVLVGLRVQILEVAENRSRYTDEVYRGAYYVYMGVPGLLDHDPAGAMVTGDQFIFAEKENLTAWRVRANNTYSLRVTPYYREAE